MNEIKVGQKYKWPSSPHDIATITKIEGDVFYYKCDSDDYEGDGLISQQVKDNDVFIEENMVKEDNAIVPPHYNEDTIDALAVIDAWKLDFRLGNVVKYIQRHIKKGTPLQDLKKAAQYLALKIKQLEDEQSK